MKSEKSVQLIEGIFTPEEAKNVLLNLVNNKISFHTLKNFSEEERLSQQHEWSIKRIEALRLAKEQILEIIEEALESNSDLKIASTIKIELREP